MKHEVFWKNPSYKGHSSLTENVECDFLIVGGGISGVSLAYFLSRLGAKNIVLIEKETIGSGATGKSAGSIVSKAELDLKDMVKDHGWKKGLFYWKCNHTTLHALKKLIQDEHIECDCEATNTLFCGFKNKNYNSVYEEYEVEKEIEPRSRLLVGKELREELNSPLFSHALLSYEHGLSVNPLKLVQNLSLAAERRGVTIYEKTAIEHIHKGLVLTPQATIKARSIILAMDSSLPQNEIKNMKSTIIVTRPLTKEQLALTGLTTKKIFWDTKKNYNYFKLTIDKRLLIGFGGILVHKKYARTDPHYPHLTQIKMYLKKLFPYLQLQLEYAWSGSFGVTEKFKPFLEIKDNRVSTGGSGSQLACVMTSEYIAHKLLGLPCHLDGFFEH